LESGHRTWGGRPLANQLCNLRLLQSIKITPTGKWARAICVCGCGWAWRLCVVWAAKGGVSSAGTAMGAKLKATAKAVWW